MPQIMEANPIQARVLRDSGPGLLQIGPRLAFEWRACRELAGAVTGDDVRIGIDARQVLKGGEGRGR
jgi:hypothetical protein